MKRRVVCAVCGVVAGAALLAGAAGGAGASATTATRHLTLHNGLVARATTVNASRLPRLTADSRSGWVRSVPLRRPMLAAGASGVTASGPAADVANPFTTVTPGTTLTGALGDQDNITSGPGALTPPDMGFAVGGNYEIELVNDVGRIWTGTTPGSVFGLASFFSPSAPGDLLSDPWVAYDAGSQRFFAGIFDVTLGGEIMSVSQTSNPTGSWFVYRIPYPGVTGGGCPDQGKGGFDSNVVALGFNEFSASQCAGGGGSFLGAALEVFNKAQMMAGATLNFTYTDPISGYFSLVPAVSRTTSETTERFASLASGSGTLLHQVTSTGVPPSTVTLTAQPDLTVKAYSIPPQARQPGTTTKIDSGDDRTQNVVTLGTKMLVTQTIGCRPTGDTAKRACARVYEVNNKTSTAKSLTISATGAYYFYPAATFVGTNVGVSVGSSSSTVFPGLDATAGPWGQAFAAPVVVASGTAKNTSGRYGDYFAASPQPGSTSVFWVAGEIGGTSGTAADKWNTAAGPVTIG